MVEIFDSLTHPTDFKNLDKLLKANKFSGACAVGCEGYLGYNHEWYSNELKHFKNIVGIAGINPKSDRITEELNYIKSLGFKGIKIHPRFSSLSLSEDSDNIIHTIHQAGKLGLVSYICTYLHTSIDKYPITDPKLDLIKILKKCSQSKVILVHGGDIRLLEYAELARFNENILLDLSYTIMKYQGSSLDLDIEYLFQTFDKRICVGTDYPDYTHKDLRIRLEQIIEKIDLSSEKTANIYSLNIKSFLGITNE